MNLILKGLIGLILSLAIASGRTLREDGQSLNFVGEGTNDLSISILQSECENRTNLVFSPLGYSAILAILAEGSRGNTRNQLVTALKLPEDLFAVRNTFKDVLTSMQDHGVVNKPEFKNWFYVYKNYTVLDNYKNVLSENYLTNVKMIENDYYYQEEQTTQQTEEMQMKEIKNEKLNFDTQKPIENYESDLKSEEKLNEVKNEETPMEEIIARAIKNEIQIEKEMMTALSANRLSTVQEGEENSTSRMIIFNALYFRGNWSIPFAPKEKLYPFHKSENEEKLVKFISSEGEFEYGQIPELDASALEVPYQEGRYSLLLLVPNTRDGLANLTSNLSGYSFRDIGKNLSKKLVSVCIPAFKFYSITKPKKALTKCGITDIFTEAADLSGISGTKGLYLDDLVQLVTLEVNENTGTYNYLTSSSLEMRDASAAPVEKFRADHPFLFFLRDRVKNLIVVAGKVHDPVRPNENE